MISLSVEVHHSLGAINCPLTCLNALRSRFTSNAHLRERGGDFGFSLFAGGRKRGGSGAKLKEKDSYVLTDDITHSGLSASSLTTHRIRRNPRWCQNKLDGSTPLREDLDSGLCMTNAQAEAGRRRKRRRREPLSSRDPYAILAKDPQVFWGFVRSMPETREPGPLICQESDSWTRPQKVWWTSLWIEALRLLVLRWRLWRWVFASTTTHQTCTRLYCFSFWQRSRWPQPKRNRTRSLETMIPACMLACLCSKLYHV